MTQSATMGQVSFLDNLENNLKALEGREEGGIDERARRDAEQKEAKEAAPWADRLRNGAWTKTLMTQATRAGFERRTKVNLAWIGTTLRLEAREKRLDLRPTPDGIVAISSQDGKTLSEMRADLDSDPAVLVSEWFGL